MFNYLLVLLYAMPYMVDMDYKESDECFLFLWMYCLNIIFLIIILWLVIQQFDVNDGLRQWYNELA